MKIAITGHTKGIGKALYDNLSQQHEVEGYSRSNGFDISNNIDNETKHIDFALPKGAYATMVLEVLGFGDALTPGRSRGNA